MTDTETTHAGLARPIRRHLVITGAGRAGTTTLDPGGRG